MATESSSAENDAYWVVTVLAILVTDLLEGVIIGLACGLFFVIRSNHHRAATVVSRESAYLVRFNKDVTFVNKNELKHKLRAIADGSDVLIDATNASYVDRDIAELVADFKTLADTKVSPSNSSSSRARHPAPRTGDG